MLVFLNSDREVAINSYLVTELPRLAKSPVYLLGIFADTVL